MTITDNAIELIKRFEGLSLTAYADPGTGGEPYTIGWGNTYFEDGKKVQPGQRISRLQADNLLKWAVDRFAKELDPLVNVNQNQFDALTSFVYNVGIGAFKKSTLRKLINANPNDPQIKIEWMKWRKAGGKVLKGLTNRRSAELELYFKN
jgi:lysozyme